MTRSLILQAPMVATGYGVAASYFYKNLIKQDVDVLCFPIQIDDTFFTNEEIDDIYASRNRYEIDQPFLKIFHPTELSLRIGKGKYIAFPFFEIAFYTFS